MGILIDASSAIDAWENYPIKQFPNVWEWMAREIAKKHLFCIQEILKEIKSNNNTCYSWLKESKINIADNDKKIFNNFNEISAIYLNPNNKKTTPSGISENDALLISTAMIKSMRIVTNEAKQNNHPGLKKHNYKIPLVCKDVNPTVPCWNFLEYLKDSNQVF